MYRVRTNILFTALACTVFAGCETPNPNAGFAPDPKAKAEIRLEPGPVDSDAPAEFTTTESGLKYRIRRKSDGKKPTPESKVNVHYRGQLDNGKIFDSSYGKTGGAIEFAVNGVISGWAEGLQLIGEGGMIELEIPPDLGYGKKGAGLMIPPDSTLHFLVELLNVR
jgi:FKBP-type peptidyl-prolyl cis-trans isomerase FkpA